MRTERSAFLTGYIIAHLPCPVKRKPKKFQKYFSQLQRRINQPHSHIKWHRTGQSEQKFGQTHKKSRFSFPSFLSDRHSHEFCRKKSSILAIYKPDLFRYNISVGEPGGPAAFSFDSVLSFRQRNIKLMISPAQIEECAFFFSRRAQRQKKQNILYICK